MNRAPEDVVTYNSQPLPIRAPHATHLLVCVPKNASERASLRRRLEGRLNLVEARGLLEAAGQVDDGDVSGGHTERHARELALHNGEHCADCLGGAGGRRDDVEARASATAPVLGRRAIHCLLRRRDRVHGCHEALLEAPVVDDDLDHWREAVGRAGRVGHDLPLRLDRVVVHTHDDHRRIVL